MSVRMQTLCAGIIYFFIACLLKKVAVPGVQLSGVGELPTILCWLCRLPVSSSTHLFFHFISNLPNA